MRAVNLLPREAPRVRRKRMSTATQLLLVAPLVAGAVLAAGHLVGQSKVNDRRATLQALRDELAAVPPSQAPEQPQNSQLAVEHEQRVTALASALRSRIAWDRILRQISSVLPEDVWLITLTAQSPAAGQPAEVVAPPVTSISSPLSGGEAVPITGGGSAGVAAGGAAPLVINGYTYSQEGVARFLSRLQVIPELDEVKLQKSENSQLSKRIVVRFTIMATIRRQETAS